jgi:hypothetical protein
LQSSRTGRRSPALSAPACGGAKAPSKFTTQVSIVPDRLPHGFEEFRKTLR